MQQKKLASYALLSKDKRFQLLMREGLYLAQWKDRKMKQHAPLQDPAGSKHVYSAPVLAYVEEADF